MDEETKKFIVSQGNLLLVSVQGSLNKYNQHICKRFDDIENRLQTIEGRLNLVHKNTEIIPDIFTMHY